MTTVMIILGAAAIGFALATWWRVPAFPLLIFVGVVVGATGLSGAPATLRDTMLLGLTFLVFVVGAELDLGRVTGQWRTAVVVAFAQFLVLATFGLIAARLLNFNLLSAAYLALAVTASSTLMIVTLLRQRQQFFEPFGRIVVGVILIQDILVILALPMLTRATDGIDAIMWGVVGTLGLIALTAVSRRWISPLIFLRLKLDEEGMLLAVLAIMFSFMGLSYLMELPIVAGAFLGGVAMSGFPVRGIVRGYITSLADFFVALFFVSLGASVTLPGLQQLALDAILLGGVLLFTPPIVMFIIRRAGLTLRSSIEASHLLAQCGEFSLIVILLGVQHGHVSPNLLAVIVLVSVITMSLTPWLTNDAVTWRLMRWIPGGKPDWPQTPPRDHVLLLGCGRNTRELADRLVSSGQSVLVIDDDAGVIQKLRDKGIHAVRGDGADYRLLRAVGARHARAVVSTMRRMRDHERLLRFVSGPQVLVRVFEDADGRRCREIGATPIVESEAAADQFMQWFERRFVAENPAGAIS